MYERTYLATSSVLDAGRELLAVSADPAARALAVDRLAGSAERGLMLLDDAGRRGFEDGASATGREAGTDEVLAAALGQLGVANMLFAASRTVGEDGEPEAAPLGRAVRELDHVVGILGRPDRPRSLGFEPSRLPTEQADVTAAFVTQVDVTLDSVVKRSTETMTRAITGMRDGGPQLVRDAWTTVNEKLHLSQIGGLLAGIAVRAVDRALALIAKVFPSARLMSMQALVDRLIDELDEGPTGLGLVAVMLGAAEHHDRAKEVAGRSDLRRDRLAHSIDALGRVAADHNKRLDLWSGIAQAIGIARAALLGFRIAVPQLELAVLGAHLIVVGAVVTLGRDSISEAGAIIATVAG